MPVQRASVTMRETPEPRRGVPREKRHIKGTYANATPATDGRHVIAFFGSQGLYAYTIDGRLLWKKDLGVLNAGAYDLPSYEWGPASSPIIYNDLVIVDGMVASVEIARLLFVADKIPADERDRVRKDLLDYCERDTWAMVKLLEKLRELASTP